MLLDVVFMSQHLYWANFSLFFIILYSIQHWVLFERSNCCDWINACQVFLVPCSLGGRNGRDRTVVGFITTYGISAYHHQRCELKSRSWRGVLDTTLCDNVCQSLAAGRRVSPGTPVSFAIINRPPRHNWNIAESCVKQP
jgi:hypothetical protein